MPVTEPIPFVKPVIVPEKFGLKSIGLIMLLAEMKPCDPTDIIKNAPTNIASQPAYAAASTNEPSITAAIN